MDCQAALQQAAKFHGHICPGLAIGVKAVEAVRKKMTATDSPDEELVCVTENDACGVDAIQALLGCTFGKGNLIFRDRGKHVYTFFNRLSGETLRLSLKARRPEKASREEWLRQLLTMDTDDVFASGPAQFQLPQPARIFQSQNCAICGEKTGEHRLRIQNGQPVCLDCYTEYSRRL